MAATTQAMNDFCKKWLAACLSRDVVWLAENSIEDDESGYLGIHSGKTIDRSIADSVASLGPAPPASCLNSAPTGWMIGDVAWLVDYPIGVLPNGYQLPEPIRVTFVMRRVGNAWKMAQWHLSESFPRNLHAESGGGRD